MPQQHNPGRHVQSLTLPQSRHNHRNTSAYIFPTVPTPRTTPPTPGTASPRRRAPTLQLPVATLPCHSRHSPAAARRSPPPRRLGPPRRHQATPRRRDPTLQLPVATLPLHSRHTPAAAQRPPTVPTLGPPPTPGHASPPGTAPPLRRAPTLQLPDATLPPHSRHTPAAAHRLHTVPTPRTTPLTQEHAPRRALPRLTAGPQCSNSPSQLARLIQGTPLPPHNGPTPSQPSDHPAGAGFNRTAGHKKIRLCEPDLFICQ